MVTGSRAPSLPPSRQVETVPLCIPHTLRSVFQYPCRIHIWINDVIVMTSFHSNSVPCIALSNNTDFVALSVIFIHISPLLLPVHVVYLLRICLCVVYACRTQAVKHLIWARCGCMYQWSQPASIAASRPNVIPPYRRGRTNNISIYMYVTTISNADTRWSVSCVDKI